MGKKRKANGTAVAKLSAFDESALAQLTDKLDRTLDGPKPDAPSADAEIRQTNGERKRTRKRKAPQGEDGVKSKKSRNAASGRTTSADLLAEIKALGGDEEDLALVADIDSGEDQEDGDTYEPPTGPLLDKGLKAELVKFASGLGFQDLQQDEDDETSESEQEDVAAEEQEEDEESIEAPARQPEVKPRKGKLILQPRPDWHAATLLDLPLPVSQDARKFMPTVERLKTHARGVLDTDAANYQASQASSSSSKFMSTIMSSGTQSDKVSALTLAIQASPVHNIRAFDNLIGLAGKNNRGQAIAALGAIVDLLGNGAVLPSDRRLRAFGSQPGLIGYLQDQELYDWQHSQNLPPPLTDEHLALWAFEDWLKDAYFRIVQLLEKWTGDEIVYSRQTTLDYVYGLLRDKPEQEANLLRLLVNKLGDKERKIASRASYLILQLLTLHPGMKEIVITTVEQEVLLRPGQNIRTKYYAIITLNQTILSGKEPAVAEKLLKIYFEIFLSLLRTGALDAPSDVKGPEKDSRLASKNAKGRRLSRDGPSSDTETAQRLVSAVLTGVNRAVPFATANNSILDEHLDTLFKITHSSNFNTSIQALMLIQQLATSRHLAVDRFFRTLYESLLDPRLIASSKQAMYLNLLFRSLKNDIDVRRVKAFVKRMLQTVHLHSAAFACGMLFLVSELEKTYPGIKALVNEPEEEADEEEEVFKDVVGAAPHTNGTDEVGVDGASAKAQSVYDGRKRAPEHSNADRSCLWELIPFLRHFHPSVTILAANLITRQKALPKPELANHTIIHFLDKFVYRNPKSTETKRGTSIMQPVLAGGSSVQAVLPGRAGASQNQTQVNSASFWNLKQDQVAAEDVFFHEYFAQVGKPGRAVKTKKQKAEGEEEEGSLGGEGEGEDEIWQALVSSKPELDGINGEDDDDVDMDDLEDLDEAMDNLSDSDDSPGSDGSMGLQLDDMGSDDEDSAFSDEGDEAVDEGRSKPHAIGADKTNGRLRRKELKSLPTFASADDYAEMLAGEDKI